MLPSRKQQSGLTLIEVMIALTVFVVASAGLLMSIGALYSANVVTKNLILTTDAMDDLSATIQGNPAAESLLNGLNLTKGGTGTNSPLSNWWISAQVANPYLESAAFVTTPASCTAGLPCQIMVTLTEKLPGKPVLTKSFVIQDGF
jgi:prepilin-type N-terminal cleavage/methylation domain-containing protein